MEENHYNTIKLYSYLNHLTPGVFDPLDVNEDLSKWRLQKQMKVWNIINSLNELKKLSEDSVSKLDYRMSAN